MIQSCRTVGLALFVTLVAAACISNGSGSEETQPGAEFPFGGTLRVGMEFDFSQNLDPHKEFPQGLLGTAGWELYRCCLLRTLLSYNGRPTDEGGTSLRPDLAAEMPDVSGDGLRWTFRLKQGLRYAPPLDDQEIVASDIIRGLLRAADPVGSGGIGYSFHFSVIDGFDDVLAGEVDSIAGLSAPDAHTLVVRLERPTGDLGYRLSLPAAAPIPRDPFHPDAPLGVAEGHGGNYGQYLVASGPYMLEGSENLDFSKAPLLQPGAAGFRSGTGVTLVRNPSWSQDALRPAYVDRIEITNYMWRNDGDRFPLYVDDGRLDVVLDANPPPDQLARYRSNDDLAQRVHQHESNTMRYLTINTAIPPFDDLHVRRATALAIDITALATFMRDTGWLGDPVAHLAVDSLEEGLLEGTELLAGGLDAAVNEMRVSAYDHDGDGTCDDPTCIGVSYGEVTGRQDDPVLTEYVRDTLSQIGIELAEQPNLPPFALQPAPEYRIALAFGFGLPTQADYPNATTLFASRFAGVQITEGIIGTNPNLNASLLGAASEQLAEWGYGVNEVPNIDDRIERCVGLIGSEQVRCWADLDLYMMTQIVPAVPIGTDAVVRIVSERVVHYSLDQFTALPALDQIALAPGSD